MVFYAFLKGFSSSLLRGIVQEFAESLQHRLH